MKFSMHSGKHIFAQIIEFIPRREFDKFVEKYKGNNCIRSFDCRDQLLSLMFGQLTNIRSLRGIVLCLNAYSKMLYHLGFKTKDLVLSTLARANENRDWRIYQDLAGLLIKKARKLYVDDNDFKIELDGAVYALDSTVIELCFSAFKWAKFKQESSGVKIHTQLDLKGNIPSFFLITNANVHDVNFLDALEIEAGAFYVMDRGYIDFERLWRMEEQKAFFVTRAKNNFSFKRIYSDEVDKKIGLRCDQVIKLEGNVSKKHYPGKLRRIKYFDFERNKMYVFLTNNFRIDAKTIADLYKRRWQIELFFKWIKQHLRIEVFWGYSANAVKTQICAALCAFLLVAIMKKELKIKRNLYEILQILSVSPFEKIPLNTLLSETDLQIFEDQSQKRLFLLDY
jgi:hypothetical protein